jgi:hypothetical protein
LSNLCSNCGTTTNNPKFCSRSCSTTSNNKLNPRRIKTKFCRRCLTPILSRQTYCGICWNMGRMDRERVTIGDIQRSAKYQISAYIRHDARRAYKRSDLPKRCLVCKYATHIEICHRRPIRDFSEDALVSDVNMLSNLVALCPTHHWELDTGYLIL